MRFTPKASLIANGSSTRFTPNASLIANGSSTLDEHTAHARQQETAHQGAASAAQRFIQERATLERQQGEAAHRQRLLDEETAHLRRAAQARQTAAARVIFLWLRHRHLFAQLAHQTSWRLQHEVALACLQHEQECCACAALAEAQRQQKSAACMKALANEDDKRRQQVLAAATLADEQLCRGENEHSPSATAATVAAERVGREVAERTLRLADLALVVEQKRREAAECALALATTALAAALKCQEAAERTSAMAILMLVNVQKRQQAAKRAQMSANIVRSLSPTLPNPMSFVGAILSTIGGGCQASPQILQSTTANEWAAITLHQTARQRKCPRCRPGCRNVPRAPNLADEAIPSHPLPSMGGASMPTTKHTKSVRTNDQDPRLPMSSISPFSMMSSSISSLPFNMSNSFSTNSKGSFLDFFCDGDKPVPPRKRSRQHQRSRCTGRRHGPRAPDLQEYLLGERRHRPHAPNQSTCHGWE